MNDGLIENRCFPPISQKNSRILILGSFPGVKSLEARHYYGHPQNSFWKIISALIHVEDPLIYQERVIMLKEKKIALWDVLQGCRRSGSLDSAIDPASIMVNDITDFLCNHKAIKAIFFNGSRAETEFLKKVLPLLGDVINSPVLQRLPSTSPALATMTFEEKLKAWSVITHFI